MEKNKTLNAAAQAKKDEFYTRLTDIEKELDHYRKHFIGKIVYCNCDDPFKSNFFKYFVVHFDSLGLKRLICTCYSESLISDKAYKAIVNNVAGGALFELPGNELTELQGNGDFRSEECLELLNEADIVVTNPPFSKFRDFIRVLMDHEKKFLIIGNQNAITYKEIFPLIMENRMWGGMTFNKTMEFIMPDLYELKGKAYVDENGNKHGYVPGVCWYTNLDLNRRHEKLELIRQYNPVDYPAYANYDAINVNKVSDIPFDYTGAMGVPITFLAKYNPEQFEILGCSLFLAKPMNKIADKGTYMQGGPRFYTPSITESDRQRGYKYHREYDRIVIRRK